MEFVRGKKGEEGSKARRERYHMTWAVEEHVGLVTRGVTGRAIRSYTSVIGLIGNGRDARAW